MSVQKKQLARNFSEDTSNLKSHARQNAQGAIFAARERAKLFDAETAQNRKAVEEWSKNDSKGGDGTPGKPLVDCKILTRSSCARM
jgi:hypothetical protein